MCVRACVRACVRGGLCVCAWVRACVHACMCVLMITVRDDSSATGGLIIDDVAVCLYRIENYARDLHQALLKMLITVKYMKNVT